MLIWPCIQIYDNDHVLKFMTMTMYSNIWQCHVDPLKIFTTLNIIEIIETPPLPQVFLWFYSIIAHQLHKITVLHVEYDGSIYPNHSIACLCYFMITMYTPTPYWWLKSRFCYSVLTPSLCRMQEIEFFEAKQIVCECEPCFNKKGFSW